MKTSAILIVVTLIFCACDNNNTDKPDTLPEGTYTGYFARSSPEADWQTANVTLTFQNSKFTGQSDKVHYPEICSGTYTIEGDKIDFKNECVTTADFDWTFVLNGKYDFKINGKELLISRYYDENTFDQYTLERE